MDSFVGFIKTINYKILFLALVIFIFSLTLRIWNLNAAGRWSDEPALVEKGYILVNLIKNKDFSNPFWYKEGSDHPPLSMYFYGLFSQKDLIKYDPKLASSFWIHRGAPLFNYDLTYARLVSVLVSSLAVLLVFLIAYRYFSLFSAITSSVILAMLPHFLGYSQLITYESWVELFFTACVFSYLLYLEKNTRFFLVLTGILTGFALGVKESTIVVFGFYLGAYIVYKITTNKKTVNFRHLLQIPFISLITFIAICPMPWFHLPVYATSVYNLWFKNMGLIPELIFGKRMGAHFFYYPLALLITTPAIILGLAVAGVKFSLDNRKKWIYAVLIIWFLSPFLMMLFHHRQHMVRYIIEIYTPLSILSAIGLEYLIKKISKGIIFKTVIFISLFIYLLVILLKLSPFYLEYYNELVGGTKNVYQNKLFYIGWFGEGLKDPGIYIAKHTVKNSLIGLALDPYSLGAVYRVPTLRYQAYDPKQKYDYVMVNYYKDIRLQFDESALNKSYVLVYTEKANGIDLVRVYKRI